MTNVFPELDLDQTKYQGLTGRDPLIYLQNDLNTKIASRPDILNNTYQGKSKGHGNDVYITAGRSGSKGKLVEPNGSNNPIYRIDIPEYLWELVVITKPGQGLADITADTLAFGVIIPNDTTRDDQDWKNYVTSVEDLGNFTRYKFLSNIPEDIQKAIREKQQPQILIEINHLLTTAPLMAAQDNVDNLSHPVSNVDRSSFDTSIGHDGIPEKSTNVAISDLTEFQPILVHKTNSVSEVSFSQVGIIEDGWTNSSSQISPSQVGVTQVSTSQISMQPSLDQIGTSQISPTQVTFINRAFGKVNSNQISTTEINPSQVELSQVSPSQINSTEIGSFQQREITINRIKAQSREIPSSSSIKLEELLNERNFGSPVSIHTLTPESITTINNSAQNLWNILLASQTPFDVNLQLTSSLAKGQLAEAIFTKYDSTRTPHRRYNGSRSHRQRLRLVHRPHHNRPQLKRY
ncbi:MAG: DNA/RNA non-specific endonuclease [Nostoc sp.]